jgi:hypothetical protein
VDSQDAFLQQADGRTSGKNTADARPKRLDNDLGVEHFDHEDDLHRRRDRPKVANNFARVCRVARGEAQKSDIGAARSVNSVCYFGALVDNVEAIPFERIRQ